MKNGNKNMPEEQLQNVLTNSIKNTINQKTASTAQQRCGTAASK
ncbi:hypothetical protein [Anaerocolumna aminovalerica]|nr:hypothetical protein [Anaerocolumna aminovalerica]